MSEKEDRRIRHTKQAIRSALSELIKEKDIDKITVTEICKLADINRSSFYAHYADAPALIDEYEEEMANLIVKKYNELYQGGAFSQRTLVEGLIKIFAENPELAKLLLRNNSRNKGINIIKENFREKSYKNWLGQPSIDIQKAAWMFEFIINGCAGAIIYWYENEFEGNFDDLVDTVSGMMTHGLYYFVYK